MQQSLKERIRHVPDFPKPGILFYDVTTLLKDREGFRMAVEAMAEPHQNSGVDLVVGIESRGFIFGSAIADRLKAGFAPVRSSASSRRKRAAHRTRSNTDRTRSRFTKTPRRRGSACSSSMICSRPAAPRRRPSASSAALARTSSACSS